MSETARDRHSRTLGRIRIAYISRAAAATSTRTDFIREMTREVDPVVDSPSFQAATIVAT